MARLKKRADGRCKEAIYLGVDPNTGKKQYKYVYGKSSEEARAKANVVRAKLKRGINICADRDTFEQWRDRWLAIKKTTISAGQYKAYECISAKLVASIGHRQLIEITTPELQEIINAMADCNPTTHRPTARKTLNDYKITLQQIFDCAVENRVTDFNPAVYIRLPKNAPKQTRRALSPDEQTHIRETYHRAQTAAMIMMYAGLRRGELLALTWNDIDLHEQTINVNKSVEIVTNTARVKAGGKTACSTRVVDIPKVLCDYLADQPRETLLVCTASNSQQHTGGSWKRMWESYMQTLNERYYNPDDRSRFSPGGIPMLMPPITAHMLRHTYATLLYLAGVDVLTAKEQLGHSDIKTTLNIYTHLDKEYKRKSMSKLDAYLSPDAGQDAGQTS